MVECLQSAVSSAVFGCVFTYDVVCFFDWLSEYIFVSVCLSVIVCLLLPHYICLFLSHSVSMNLLSHILYFSVWHSLSLSFSVFFWSFKHHWSVRWPWYDSSCRWSQFCISAFQSLVSVTWIMKMNVFRWPPMTSLSWRQFHLQLKSIVKLFVFWILCCVISAMTSWCYNRVLL